MDFIGRLVASAAIAITFTLSCGSAYAQSDNSLDRIKKAGTVRVGVEFGRPPWAFKDENLKMAGYDPEVAVHLANDLGVKLEVVEITGPNRVPFLVSNRVDMVISTFSITPERAKVIDFSVPYASAMVMLAAPASADIKNAADLKGHKVGVTRGTTGDMELTKQAPNATIVRFEDEATTVTAVSSGQIEIVAGEPVMLLGVAKHNPGKRIEQKFVLADFSVGIGLRKNETELKAWVNNWVRDNLRNGKLNGLFKKFHGVDLPPTVVNASQ